MAKTFSVAVPEDKTVKLLIDKTAEFVVSEGWEFEKLLVDKERTNPRFAFMLSEAANTEDPLHLYYRWKTFSLSQGDLGDQWRIEPFQIYVNGPLWQPPPCVTKEMALAEAVEMQKQKVPTVELSKSRPARSSGAGGGG
eukprot:CAMPEP_0169398550 /NCGR_PEP_ID=MMETSP1017-20121227/52711_1 /TAXON_ID=342587 /ORGANISM="Karlodinium micrum, Strain CCMP2283" /LENGTH=138 /DNA_ID=CAMNT_0009503563 /DNA_START=21 /DNA_END=434 /DNA_ORIENTATION=+